MKNEMTKVTLVYDNRKESFNAPQDVIESIKNDAGLKLVTDGLIKVYVNIKPKRDGYEVANIVLIG